jgi:small subunit ribosomal protein S16
LTFPAAFTYTRASPKELFMAVVLRLARAGAKKMPYYHVVATDSRNPRDGKFIEAIGAYDPNLEPPKFEVNQERLEHWLKVGAQPSETVADLIKRSKKLAKA